MKDFKLCYIAIFKWNYTFDLDESEVINLTLKLKKYIFKNLFIIIINNLIKLVYTFFISCYYSTYLTRDQYLRRMLYFCSFTSFTFYIFLTRPQKSPLFSPSPSVPFTSSSSVVSVSPAQFSSRSNAEPPINPKFSRSLTFTSLTKSFCVSIGEFTSSAFCFPVLLSIILSIFVFNQSWYSLSRTRLLQCILHAILHFCSVRSLLSWVSYCFRNGYVKENLFFLLV